VDAGLRRPGYHSVPPSDLCEAKRLVIGEPPSWCLQANSTLPLNVADRDCNPGRTGHLQAQLQPTCKACIRWCRRLLRRFFGESRDTTPSWRIHAQPHLLERRTGAPCAQAGSRVRFLTRAAVGVLLVVSRSGTAALADTHPALPTSALIEPVRRLLDLPWRWGWVGGDLSGTARFNLPPRPPRPPAEISSSGSLSGKASG